MLSVLISVIFLGALKPSPARPVSLMSFTTPQTMNSSAPRLSSNLPSSKLMLLLSVNGGNLTMVNSWAKRELLLPLKANKSTPPLRKRNHSQFKENYWLVKKMLLLNPLLMINSRPVASMLSSNLALAKVDVATVTF